MEGCPAESTWLARRIFNEDRAPAFGIDGRNATSGNHDSRQTDIPAPGHDHERCAADAILHAEKVCERRAQKFTPIRRQVLQALLSSHRPLGAYEVIDELAKSMPRPAPITVYRALDFLMDNGLVHRIESRNAYLACAHDHDAAAMVAFLICERCGSVGEISGRSCCAKPQRRGALHRLHAEIVGGRDHRHLRALPGGLNYSGITFFGNRKAASRNRAIGFISNTASSRTRG